jgi:hypothetical protein
MSRKKRIDKRARNAGIGLAGLVAAVIGIGWARSRASAASPCKIIEDSVYRGFRYRIEECPRSDGSVFTAVIPVQAVASHRFDAELRDSPASLELARKWVQLTIDQKLGPTLRATFVGANRT